MKLNNILSFFLCITVYSTCLKSAQLLNQSRELDDFSYAKVLNKNGTMWRQQGRHTKALDCYNQALSIYRKNSSTKHSNYAHTLYNIGLVYYNKKEYNRAMLYFKQALSIYEDIQRYCSGYGNVLYCIGLTYLTQTEYGSAMIYYQKALKIYGKVLGDKDLKYARTLNDIASIDDDQGEYDKAIKNFQLALNIYKHEKKEIPYATTLNNLGLAYEHKKNYKEAVKCYEETLKIYETVLGKNSPEYANTLHHLEVISHLFMREKEQQTTPLHGISAENVKVIEDNLKKEDSNYFNKIKKLRLFYFVEGKYDIAIKYQKEIMKIYQEKLTKNHPTYANALNNLAIIYHRKKEYDTALEYYKKALMIREKKLDKQHKDYLDTVQRIKAVYQEINKPMPKDLI